MARPNIPFSILFFSLLVLVSSSLFGQEKCGVVEYEKLRHRRNSTLETPEQFEQWMREKIRLRKTKSFQTQVLSYTIPVVVHIIHNGEAIGSGTNLSDNQVNSQIRVINEDFKRLNADRNNTPLEFQDEAAAIDINFVLAKQDPEGLSTSGITRTRGTKTSWTISDNVEFKALSYWPAEDYLNLWVVNLSGNLIGFAQLPESGQLQGLDESSTDRLTDGVIINYKDFGSIDDGPFVLDPEFNKGRTATHEIGHFFGLRHIWGDNTCGDDYVSDTPAQQTFTSACPTGDQPSSCSSAHKMYQNYLDFTNDACMNLFTQGQVDRMTVILANSPRRATLPGAHGVNPPSPVANNLGIKKIVSPSSSICTGAITPVIEVRNYGSNIVTSAQIRFSINAGAIETVNFPLNLNPEEVATLSFSHVTLASGQQVSFDIILTNGITDVVSPNTLSVGITIPPSTTLPFNEPFNSLPSAWQTLNPDGLLSWSNVVAADANPSNKAMYINFHAYENRGTLDWLITPSFSLSNPLTSQLRFDIAYALYPQENEDALKVYALPNCNQDLSQAILLYEKTGQELATAPTTSNPFVPTSASQWRKSEVRSLSTLSPSTSWQLAFIGKNGYGNNIYLDNASVNDQIVNDLAITQIVSPGLVHCQAAPSIKFKVKNYSTSTITNFQVLRSLNGGIAVSQNFTTVLEVGAENTFALNPVTLTTGINSITITVKDPEGLPDSFPANNTASFATILEQSTDETPLRMTFDSPSEIPWTKANPEDVQPWEAVNTNKQQSIAYKTFTNTMVGEESWFVSPVLDLSRYTEQTLFFDLSYAQKVPAEDRLKLLASKDCGLTYDQVLFDRAGSELSIKTSATEWSPVTDVDWTNEYVSLNAVAGNKNIRLAFVATNEHGNNIYLDNIEIFAGSDTQPPVSTLPYQLYYSNRNTQSDIALTFNLLEKKEVKLQVFTAMGKVVIDNLLPDTLNQTYYFDLSLQSPGIYLFRLQIDDQVATTKVYIGH